MQTPGFITLGVFFAFSAFATDESGDPLKGASFFASQACLECHAYKTVGGGRSASDLGRRLGRNYTPALMAATLWNHAPAMWAAMEKRGIGRPRLSEGAARDLFGFFYSMRYFDKSGDAGRGKQLFTANGCAGCHAISASPASAGGRPVVSWWSSNDPIMLAQQMWNHHTTPGKAGKGSPRPRISAQDLTDMLLYLQNLPEVRGRGMNYSVRFVEGAPVAAKKATCGHAQCHGDPRRFEDSLTNRTLTDVAAAIWNHKPPAVRMQPAIARNEVADFVTTVWAKEFFRERGRVDAGGRVFVRKRCAECHESSSAGVPALTSRSWSAISMVSALWEHGPVIQEEMLRKNIAWPRFKGTEMSNLIVYLNSLPRTKPPALLRALFVAREGP